jgi:hypothetical protein
VLCRLLICLIAYLAQTPSRGDKPAESLPRSVQSVREQIQGKTADQINQIISTNLGKPSKDVGSGRHIYCWDFPEGSLIGLRFTFKSGQVVWLMKTHNPLRENLLQSYEMCSASNRHWLGDIVLRTDGRYEFKKADVNQDGWFDGQESNYFLQHPQGTFKIDFPSRLKPNDLLESAADGAVVAKLLFASKDGPEKVFLIATDTKSRLLSFSSSEPIKFEMTTPWRNYLR